MRIQNESSVNPTYFSINHRNTKTIHILNAKYFVYIAPQQIVMFITKIKNYSDVQYPVTYRRYHIGTQLNILLQSSLPTK